MRSKGDPTKSPARGQYHPCSISPISRASPLPPLRPCLPIIPCSSAGMDSCGTLLSLHSPRKIPLHAFVTLASLPNPLPRLFIAHRGRPWQLTSNVLFTAHPPAARLPLPQLLRTGGGGSSQALSSPLHIRLPLASVALCLARMISRPSRPVTSILWGEGEESRRHSLRF